MATKTVEHIRLRTVPELVEAHEWLFNKQKAGEIDAKTADALNTTLKGQVYLVAKLRLDAAKLWITTAVKKLSVPQGMLPEFGTNEK